MRTNYNAQKEYGLPESDVEEMLNSWLVMVSFWLLACAYNSTVTSHDIFCGAIVKFMDETCKCEIYENVKFLGGRLHWEM